MTIDPLGLSPIVDFTGGGSGTGVSYYMTATRCPRKLRLNEELKEENSKRAGFFRADIGTVFHKLAELYHGGVEDAGTVVELATAGGEEALAEGQRLFSGYTNRFPVDAWGTPVAVEVPLPGPCDKDCAAFLMENKTGCECDRRKRVKALNEMFIVPFTSRIDMVTEVDESNMAAVAQRLGKPEINLGTYLLDHKTKARKDANMHLVYNHSVQFKAYMLAWNAIHPDNPCNGMIVNVVVGHKKLTENSFCSVLVPPPTQEDEMIVGTFLLNAGKLSTTDLPNLSACFEFGPCPHLASGACNRR